MTFKVGDKVIALNVEGSMYLHLGTIYTIKRIDIVNSKLSKIWFYLEEIPHYCFKINRFDRYTHKQEMEI
jgi:hypothetical protein